MKKLRHVVEYKLIERKTFDYGKVTLKLKEYLDKNNITRNELSVSTEIKYQTIDRYYQNRQVERIDLTLLAKICYALNCDVSDLIEYIPPLGDKK